MLDNDPEIIALLFCQHPANAQSHCICFCSSLLMCIEWIILHEVCMKNNCVLELELWILHLFVFIGFIK